MKIRKMDHVGIVVNDLAAAKVFFLDLGLILQGEAELEGEKLDKIIGLNGVKDAIAYFNTPEGEANIELIQFYSPVDPNGVQKSAANTLGIRHVTFLVEDIDAMVANLKAKGTEVFSEVMQFGDTYKVVYVRGPEGIILELAEEINK
jgi:catechol 2,3-dioxygenase-like lactoylglutathione lyase family enzyme